MKLLVMAVLFTTGHALAYTSSTVGNNPVPDPAWVSKERVPASHIQDKKMKEKKVYPEKKQTSEKQS